MNTFSFELFGGYKVIVDQGEVTINYAGEKFLFFQKSKPRETVIPLKDVIRVDMKESSTMAFGYIRFVTAKMDEYQSSSYMARHDAFSFMIDKGEETQMNQVLGLIKKYAPNVPIVKNKN